MENIWLFTIQCLGAGAMHLHTTKIYGRPHFDIPLYFQDKMIQFVLLSLMVGNWIATIITFILYGFSYTFGTIIITLLTAKITSLFTTFILFIIKH